MIKLKVYTHITSIYTSAYNYVEGSKVALNFDTNRLVFRTPCRETSMHSISWVIYPQRAWMLTVIMLPCRCVTRSKTTFSVAWWVVRRRAGEYFERLFNIYVISWLSRDTIFTEIIFIIVIIIINLIERHQSLGNSYDKSVRVNKILFVSKFTKFSQSFIAPFYLFDSYQIHKCEHE